MAIVLLGSFLFEAQWGQALVRGLLAVITFASWRGYQEIHELNRRQLQVLGQIRVSMALPDGGSVDPFEENTDSGGKSKGGALAGAIAGGIAGSIWGPEGAIIGALIGAALGDEVEEEDSTDEFSLEDIQ